MKISMSEYCSRPGITSSALRAMGRGPAYFKAVTEVPPRQTEPMKMGSAVHALMSGLFEDEVMVFDGDRRTKDGKVAYTEAQESGKAVITSEQYEMALSIEKAIRTHDLAKTFLYDAEFETSYFWGDPPCKARIDFMSGTAVGDFKIVQDPRPQRFMRSVLNYEYHLQAAWYLLASGGDRFYWIAASNTPPVEVYCYEASIDLLRDGKRLCEERYQQIVQCRIWDYWPIPEESLRLHVIEPFKQRIPVGERWS